jgi:aminobutyraldehyde dehydrogenase
MATCCPSSAWPSHLVLASEVPWGGFKGSGYGRDLSLYALDDYSRTKHVMHNHTR